MVCACGTDDSLIVGGVCTAGLDRFSELTHTLRRKSSLSSVWAELGVNGGAGSVPATPHGDGGGEPAVGTPAVSGSIPGTPATHVPGTPA